MYINLKKRYFSLAASVVLCGGFMVGCGSSDSKTTPPNDTTTSGKIVDPYIVGAILCEDVDKDGVCESGEQKSTASTDDGEFTFSNALTSGSHIIISTQGKHNGVKYDLNLSGVVNVDGEIDVVSPITTLETRGLSKAQIVTLLTDAGITGLSQTDISSDPMSGLSGKTSVTNDELKKLQTSLAVYGLLKIMKGSDALTALTSTQLASSNEVQTIASSMVTAIKSSLNATTFSTIKSSMDAVRTGAGAYGSYIPDVTTDVIIKTAVTVMDRIVEAGYAKCNETDGDVTLALAEAMSTANSVNSQVETISQYYYGLENKALFASIPNQLKSALPSFVQQGISNNTGLLTLNAENEFSTVETQRINNLYGVIDLNGGTLGDSTINIVKLDTEIVSLSIENDQNVTTDYPFTSIILNIDPTTISDGKNKLTIVHNNGSEKYLEFYKGMYNSLDDNNSVNGNTNYSFNNLRANGVVASDMFVSVDNYNDVNTTYDDRWIYILPNNSGNIAVTNLNASGGYRVDSIEYEQYIVANPNSAKAGQDINTSSNIDVRKFVAGQSISGTLKKIDTTTNGLAEPFSQTLDATNGNIWVHAHYTNSSATYSSVCNGAKCENNETGDVWVGTQDMHLENGSAHTSATYNFTNGEYSINKLATNTGYTLLAFWKAKNILGTNYSVESTTGNDIVMQGLNKDVNGTLDSFDKVRIARVVTFSGQPNILYSKYADKNGSNIFTLNYQQDSSGTSSYILWGNSGDTLELNATIQSNCDDGHRCRAIKIGGDDDNSTNINLVFD